MPPVRQIRIIAEFKVVTPTFPFYMKNQPEKHLVDRKSFKLKRSSVLAKNSGNFCNLNSVKSRGRQCFALCYILSVPLSLSSSNSRPFLHVAGYGYSRTEAPSLYSLTCVFERGCDLDLHMLPYIERSTIRARTVNKHYVNST